MGLYEYQNQEEFYPDKWKEENVKEYKEALFDRISQLLIKNWTQIQSFLKLDLDKDEYGLTIKNLQKTIRDQEIQVYDIDRN